MANLSYERLSLNSTNRHKHTRAEVLFEAVQTTICRHRTTSRCCIP